MRIECDQCASTFSIDDAMISDRGVRAQCPKCGTQKVVRKPPPETAAAANPFASAQASNPFGAAPGPAAANPFAAPTNPFAAPAAAGVNPFGAAAPNNNPFGAPAPTVPVNPVNPFTAPTQPFGGAVPASNPFGAAARGSDPFGVPTSFPPSKEGAAVNPFAAAPQTNPFAVPTSGAPKTGLDSNPFGAPINEASANPFTDLGLAKTPTSPPKERDPFADISTDGPALTLTKATPAKLDDPFARIDLGDAKEKAPPPKAEAKEKSKQPKGRAEEPVLPSGAGVPPTQWRVKTKAGLDAETDLPGLRDMIKNGIVSATDEAGPIDEPLAPVHTHSALASALPPMKPSASRAVQGAAATRQPLQIPKAAIAFVVLAVLVGGVFALLKFKPELYEKKTEAGENPLRRALPAWQRQFPDVPGTFAEHIEAGKKQAATDSAQGYRLADEEFRQALILDVSDVSAIALFVENFASLPTAHSDVEGAALAQEAIAYAGRRAPGAIEVARALGALNIALGDIDAAQKALEPAHARQPDDVMLALRLAQTYLDRNPEDVLRILNSAVKPSGADLKAALVIEGAAKRRLGDFKAARDALQARLKADPKNAAALRERARLELDLSAPEDAIATLTSLLQEEALDIDAHLLRAKIAYQSPGVKDGLKRADAYLTEVLTKHESHLGELILPLLSHAAYVKAQLGDLDGALALAERARATQPEFPPAQFVLGRVHRMKGSYPEAKRALELALQHATTSDSFYVPTIRSELAAVLALAKNIPAAVRAYEEVIDYDPRALRAYFGLASVYMGDNKPMPALTLLRKALQIDPAWEHDRPTLTDYPVPVSDLVAMADAFRAAKATGDDASLGALRSAGEAMMRYHALQRAEARKLCEQALGEDDYNHTALLYLGVMQLEDNNLAGGKRSLRTAAENTGKGHGITSLYLARAELATGEVDAAKNRLIDLVAEDGGGVAAMYTLSTIYVMQDLPQKAEAEWRKIVRRDPDYAPAKKALGAS